MEKQKQLEICQQEANARELAAVLMVKDANLMAKDAKKLMGEHINEQNIQIGKLEEQQTLLKNKISEQQVQLMEKQKQFEAFQQEAKDSAQSMLNRSVAFMGEYINKRNIEAGELKEQQTLLKNKNNE
ncbi:hypothetical protein [Endozoicomonas sp.]|uniref:hypothetical protein n=1 Tax=Endozoicomonas sp. TaxID=1892382 RepID=UPI00383B4BE3